MTSVLKKYKITQGLTPEKLRLILQELCDNPNIKVSVVSTGIKKRVENYLNSTYLDNIVVINNPIIK